MDSFNITSSAHMNNSGSSLGTATSYGMDGPGIESRRVRDFPHRSRTALGPTQQYCRLFFCIISYNIYHNNKTVIVKCPSLRILRRYCIVTCQCVAWHRLFVVYNDVTVDTISRKETQVVFRLTICALSFIDLQINAITAITKILFPSSVYSNFHSSDYNSRFS